MEIEGNRGEHLILVDLDNTSAELDPAFDKRAGEIVSPEIFAKRNIGAYWIEEIFAHAVEYHKQLNDIFAEEGFFLNLEPFLGVVEAIHEMINEGLEIYFCSTPNPNSQFCHFEKDEWIRKYFGEEYVLRTIYTFDKTVIYGDILIDDKPQIKGLREKNPFWTHVLFDHRHNKNVDTKHRLKSWKDWRKVIYPILNLKSLE